MTKYHEPLFRFWPVPLPLLVRLVAPLWTLGESSTMEHPLRHYAARASHDVVVPIDRQRARGKAIDIRARAPPSAGSRSRAGEPRNFSQSESLTPPQAGPKARAQRQEPSGQGTQAALGRQGTARLLSAWALDGPENWIPQSRGEGLGAAGEGRRRQAPRAAI